MHRYVCVNLLCVLVAAGAVGQTKSARSAAATSASQGFVYQLRPKANVPYVFDTRVEVSQTYTAMGMEQTVASTLTSQQVWNARAQDTTVEVSVRQRNVRLQLKGLQQVGGSDSTLTLESLEKYAVVYTFNRRGKVLAQRVVHEDSTMSAVQRSFVEQVVGSGVRIHPLVEFPDEALQPGKQWKTTVRDTAVLGLASHRIITTIDLLNTFEGFIDTLGKRCAVVRIESSRYLFSGSSEQMGMEVNINGDGVLSMRCLVEVETGLPLVVEATAQLDQRITMPEQGNMVIPVSVDVRTRSVRQL